MSPLPAPSQSSLNPQSSILDPHSILNPHYDLFCTVVDNFGDIGVCWRLARQLAGERGKAVRLWVDDLTSFARLCPTIDPAANRQTVQGIEVIRWQEPLPEIEPEEVVIEAFACELPESFIQAMLKRPTPPLWLNLEYLSAEDWVEGCHGLPSPARPPLLKHFFFPGFTTRTGGLIRESALIEARDAFQSDEAAIADYWHDLGLPPKGSDELRISLFSYPNPALPELLRAWQASSRPITVLAPEGTASARLAADILPPHPANPRQYNQGNLRVQVIPFTDQPGYDRLLQACDLNFVRGEDSFVRAQWAGRPFVWHIYPQEEDAHLIKLNAFLDRMTADFPASAAQALSHLWQVWNGASTEPAGEAWEQLSTDLRPLSTAALNWSRTLSAQTDLATNLENFQRVRI